MTHLITISILHLKKKKKKSDILLPDGEILSTSTVTKDYAEWQVRSDAWKLAHSYKLYWRALEQFSALKRAVMERAAHWTLTLILSVS